MARVSLNPPRTITNRLVTWFSKRRFGRDLTPGLAAGHNRRVLMTIMRVQLSSDRWNRAPRDLKHLAVMRAAVTLECDWCIDFGYWQGVEKGIDPAKIQAVPNWRESTVFSPLERLALEYAEAMTATPSEVTDELSQALREQLGDAALVELTGAIGLENLYGRTNSALGLASQGFKENCELPVNG